MDSDGNRVNVGNFDANGLNVNNWNDERNSNIGLASSRNFFPFLTRSGINKSPKTNLLQGGGLVLTPSTIHRACGRSHP